MNPFHPETQLDSELLEIASRLFKQPESEQLLKRLLLHMPNIDIDTDISILTKILKKIIPIKNILINDISNRIVYFILKRSGMDVLKCIECLWLYHNFNGCNKYRDKIMSSYFNIQNVEDQFYGLVAKNIAVPGECDHCIEAFIYLIENTNKEYRIDLKVETASTEQLLKILKCSGASTGWLHDDIRRKLEMLSASEDPLQLEKKYKILCLVYKCVPGSVYEDFKYLEYSTAKQVLELDDPLLRGSGTEKLKLSSSEQLELVLQYTDSKEKTILFNPHLKLNLINLIFTRHLSFNFVRENEKALRSTILYSVNKVYQCIKYGDNGHSKITRENYKEDAAQNVLSAFSEVSSGKEKIYLLWMLGRQENPLFFDRSDIEESIECSIDIFPKEYFLSNEFDCSAVPLIKKYGDAEDVRALIKRFRRTSIVDLVFHLRDRELIKELVLEMRMDDVNLISRKITEGKQPREPAILNTMLYYRRRKGDNNLDFRFILECLLNAEFLMVLLDDCENRTPFIKEVLLYINSCEFKNTVYYRGYNFDEDPLFFYNFDSPQVDGAISKILKVFKKLKNPRVEDLIFVFVLKIFLFKSQKVLSEFKSQFPEFKKYFEGGSCDSKELIAQLARLSINNKAVGNEEARHGENNIVDLLIRKDSLFHLPDKPWLVERLLREIYEIPSKITLNTLNICRNKSMDILLRSGVFDRQLLPVVSTAGLSPEGLRSWVGFLLEEPESPKKPDCDALVIYRDGVIRDLRENGLTSSIEKGGKLGYDILTFLENDVFLFNKTFRAERIKIYEPIISKISTLFAQYLMDTFSFSKLETNASNDLIFDLLISPLIKFPRMFWKILVDSLHLLNNINIPLFIENICLSFTIPDSCKKTLSEYLLVCTNEELALFSFVFPTFASSTLPSKSLISLKSILIDITKQKIQNTKMMFVEYPGSRYQIELKYRLDSVSYSAKFLIPVSFPYQMPSIEFDHDKCPKLYRKLNEILKTSTKFVEVFMLLKMNLDNRIAGYSECPICYYIIEPKTKTLTDFGCDVCKNAFHKKCIFEWVKNSHDTRCPMCRSNIPVWDK